MYFVSISNGIFEPKHRRKIGIAIWEFMWLLDRVTKITGDGFGVILGGKPIKLREISGCLGIGQRQIERNLIKLTKENYISIKRAPYGLIINVRKCQKRFARSVVSGYDRSVVSLDRSVVSNKTVQLDNTNISVAPQRTYKKMKTYDENKHKDELPSINSETGELEEEPQKVNQNEQWQKFRAFWEAVVLKDRGFM